MKIVKESLGNQGFFRSEDPIKHLGIGEVEVFKTKLQEKGIGDDEIWEVKDSIQKIAHKYAYTSRQGNKEVFFDKNLSDALEESFGEDYKMNKKDSLHTPATRSFFKKIITETVENGDEIDVHDLLKFWSEFVRTIWKDPILFHTLFSELLDKCESNRDSEERS
jgi:hypothetical protein